eukprot:CAMPEP_0194033618 /NCGR_PEP_ID=MMETSP0009_2-20130614/6236_1 /TAXON_ID=210454 /ORGANISM="Grammatophora oceanica, Strain CCMP 410" /LENGTH=512 /DNA_ID=CAMNT_0038674333 /DNA_START=73 /DNA_END=1611 /DNA_ORIENTATION=+
MTTNGMDCPVDMVAPGTACLEDGKVCLWGEQECCGQVFSTMLCNCAVDKWECFPSDECKNMNCEEELVLQGEIRSDEADGQPSMSPTMVPPPAGPAFLGLVSFDCAATPYDNGTTCDVGGAFCEWYDEEDGNGGTECFCGDFSATTSSESLAWDCYNWESWTGFPEYDCPAEPLSNNTSCDVDGAYCFWEEASNSDVEWTDCFCFGDMWDCYNGTYTEIPEIDCPDVPFENGTSCGDAQAFCYWDDEETDTITDCWCSPDGLLWDCYEFEDFDIPLDYKCPEEPASNGTTCDTNGAFCFWEPNPEEGFTECFCNNAWECSDWKWTDFNILPEYDCGETPFENGTACDQSGAFCYWDDNTTYSDCFCSDFIGTPTWECYEWDDDMTWSPTLMPEVLDYDCPTNAVANNSACEVDGAFCLWEEGTGNSFTDCFCFESMWECYVVEIFPDVFEAGNSCPTTVGETGDECGMDGEFCFWESEDGNAVDECFCGEGTFDCVKGSGIDPKLFEGTLPV